MSKGSYYIHSNDVLERIYLILIYSEDENNVKVGTYFLYKFYVKLLKY